MPASQPTRATEEETLRLSSNSLCSTTFSSRQQRRPVYATTTQDRRTSLWHIDPAGTLTEVARISWAEGPNRKNGSSISFPSHPGARVIKAEDFLTRAKGLFSSDSRTFQYGELSCKWRSGDDSGSQPLDRPSEARYAAGVWHCRATSDHPQTSSSACPLIARFSSSRFGVARSEVTLYSPWVSVPRFVYNNQPQADYPLDLASTIILSIILLVVHKDEWKDERACLQTPETLRAQLEEALLATELPSYTASRVGRDRNWVVIGDEPPRRRRHPHSTTPSPPSMRPPAEPSPPRTPPTPPPPHSHRPIIPNINTTAYRSRCAPSPAEDTQPLLPYLRTASRPPSAPVRPTPQRHSRTITITPPRTADAASRPRAFSPAQHDQRLPPPYSPPPLIRPQPISSNAYSV